MKILYISQFYYPERAAGSFRAIDNSIIWNECGNEVVIFTTYPNFPSGEIFKGYSNELLSEDEYKGIKIIRNKMIARKNTSKINRAISSVSFIVYSLYNIIFKSKYIGTDYDVVLGTSGTILAPIIAYIFSKKNKIPFILELRDITYNQILAVYTGKNKILYNIVKFVELTLCKKADSIVVVTHGFKQKLIEDGIDSSKIYVIENGAILENLTNKVDKKQRKRVTFSYVGNIGGSQNLNRIVDVFNYIELENLEKRLLIIGDGGKKERLKDYINNKKIKNIEILDGMDYRMLNEYYKKSDFCIVSLNNNEKFKDTIPSKIFSIMSNKKPILFFGPKGEASNIIEKSKCGIVYNGNDYKQIAKEISEKINNYTETEEFEEYMKKYGELGYEFVNKYYNRNDLAKKYLKIIKESVYKNK